MTLQELEQRLNDPNFLNPENGDLFYNVFIYQYPADQEYAIREQIQLFRENLRSRATQVEPVMINLYEQYMAYLDQRRFLKHPSMLRYLMEREESNPKEAATIHQIVQRNAQSKEFIEDCEKYIFRLQAVAEDLDRTRFDLDDGFVHNYAKYGDVVAKV